MTLLQRFLLELGIWVLQLPRSAGQQLPGRAGGSSVCPHPHPAGAEGLAETLPGAGDTHQGHTFTPGLRAVQCFPHQLPVNNVFPFSPYYLLASHLSLVQSKMFPAENFSLLIVHRHMDILKKKKKKFVFISSSLFKRICHYLTQSLLWETANDFSRVFL